jgi:hypothetical protein
VVLHRLYPVSNRSIHSLTKTKFRKPFLHKTYWWILDLDPLRTDRIDLTDCRYFTVMLLTKSLKVLDKISAPMQGVVDK